MEQKNNLIKKQIKFYDENRFGAMTIMITIQSCYGSIAAMYALKIDNYIALTIAVIVTMMSNAVFIAQSPSKWCVGMFNINIIANTILLLTYLFL